MPNSFASGKWAIAQCDRCSFRYKLKELRRLVIKTKNVNILVCQSCWEPDQPQLQLGMYPVDDPQAIRNPRPDTSYQQSGLSGLQINSSGGSTVDGYGLPEGGSRIIQWGWNPVGLNNALNLPSLPNNLIATGYVGSVTVAIT
jgi:hypothetical protein